MGQHTRAQSHDRAGGAPFCALSKPSSHQTKDNDALEPQSKVRVSTLLSEFIIILNVREVHGESETHRHWEPERGLDSGTCSSSSPPAQPGISDPLDTLA